MISGFLNGCFSSGRNLLVVLFRDELVPLQRFKSGSIRNSTEVVHVSLAVRWVDCFRFNIESYQWIQPATPSWRCLALRTEGGSSVLFCDLQGQNLEPEVSPLVQCLAHWLHIKMADKPAPQMCVKISRPPPGAWLQYSSLTPPPSMSADGTWANQINVSKMVSVILVILITWCLFKYSVSSSLPFQSVTDERKRGRGHHDWQQNQGSV